MTNEAIVKALFPKARIESHTTGIRRRKYYLVRDGNAFMYMAEGETKAKAWARAAEVALDKARREIVAAKSLRNELKELNKKLEP